MDMEPMSLFAMEEELAQAAPEERVFMMTDGQRAEIRSLFGQLGICDAATQFRVTEELTGSRIRSVAELEGAAAHRLINALQRRVANAGAVRTGNSWDDRDEDTWIDRL